MEALLVGLVFWSGGRKGGVEAGSVVSSAVKLG